MQNEIEKIQKALMAATGLWPKQVTEGNFVNETTINRLSKELHDKLARMFRKDWPAEINRYVRIATTVAYSESAKYGHEFPESGVNEVANSLFGELDQSAASFGLDGNGPVHDTAESPNQQIEADAPPMTKGFFPNDLDDINPVAPAPSDTIDIDQGEPALVEHEPTDRPVNSQVDPAQTIDSEPMVEPRLKAENQSMDENREANGSGSVATDPADTKQPTKKEDTKPGSSKKKQSGAGQKD